MTTIDLPEGTEHGTPEGHQAGCKGERNCPALYTHGMTCTDAHVRSVTTPDRYYKAKARGGTPAEIARTLNFHPATRAADAAPAADEERRSEASRKAHVARAARKATPEPAQPLAEHSQDPSDTTPAPTGEVAAAPPAKATAEGEEMGHPKPTAETPPKAAKRTRPKTLTQVLDAAKAKHTPPARDSAPQNLIRAWARENGLAVNPRGSVRTDIVNAYLAAHTATPPALIENITDEIDHLRNRIDMPAPAPAPADTAPRPEWATITTSNEVEAAHKETLEAIALAELHSRQTNRARSLAVRLEAENAQLLDHLNTAHTALTTTLAAWEAASVRATVAETTATAAVDAAIAAGRHAMAAENRAISAELRRPRSRRGGGRRADADHEVVRLDMSDRRATCTCGWTAWAFSTASARRAAETHATNHENRTQKES